MNTRGNRQVQSNVIGGHAVVLGGSLAGMLAARVLADHFDRVTLIERDAYPETPEVRKGTPQANHVHGLLTRGRQVLEELFPGLQDQMIAAGMPLLDMANDIAWFTRAGWGIRFPSELKGLAFTRPVLDLHVRRRLAQNPKIEIADQMEVLRLIRDGNENRVAGVLVIPRASDADRRVARELRADLVVDATGRASRAAALTSGAWLRAAQGDGDQRAPRLCQPLVSPSGKLRRARRCGVCVQSRLRARHDDRVVGSIGAAFSTAAGEGQPKRRG